MSVKIILAIALLSFAFAKRVECGEEAKVAATDSRATTTGDNEKLTHSQRGTEELPAAVTTTGSTVLPVSGNPVTRQESAETMATHSSIKRSLPENLARKADPGCCG